MSSIREIDAINYPNAHPDEGDSLMRPVEGMQVYATRGPRRTGRIARVGCHGRVVVDWSTGKVTEAQYGPEVRPTSTACV